MKLFQITEEDLADLERLVPEAMDRVTMRPDATPRDRAIFKRLQSIIVNVRWNYGPPENVERIDDDGAA